MKQILLTILGAIIVVSTIFMIVSFFVEFETWLVIADAALLIVSAGSFLLLDRKKK